MKKQLWMPLAAALFAATTIAGCAATSTSESTGEYVDDATVTSKVKAALLDDSGLKSFDISVQTNRDAVQLSGVVTSDQIRARAMQVAAGVSGVRSV